MPVFTTVVLFTPNTSRSFSPLNRLFAPTDFTDADKVQVCANLIQISGALPGELLGAAHCSCPWQQAVLTDPGVRWSSSAPDPWSCFLDACTPALWIHPSRD